MEFSGIKHCISNNGEIIMKLFGNEKKLPDIFNNPFDKKMVHYIGIEWGSWRKEDKQWEARVRFQNGDTEGAQNFTGKNLQEIAEKIQNFLATL